MYSAVIDINHLVRELALKYDAYLKEQAKADETLKEYQKTLYNLIHLARENNTSTTITTTSQ